MKKQIHSTRQLMIRRFLRNKLAVAGLLVLLLFVCAAVFAPVLTPYTPTQTDLINARCAPSAAHLLGTDDLGRDILTRMLYGGRISLSVGIASMLLQLVLGVVLGMLAGYYGGIIDAVIMRFIDTLMCFPFFVIAIALAAVIGGSVTNLVLIIGMLMWPGIARIVRSEVLALKEREFILASRALGLKSGTIIRTHIFPNVIASVVVASTLSIATGILMESTLSFLGLGVNPPTPSWGNMLTAAQNMSVLKNYWWMWIPVGATVVLTVLSVNFLGDGLRDALQDTEE